MLPAPVAERAKGLRERDSELGEGILDARRDLPEVLPRDDPVRLHLAGLLDQHLLADAPHQPPQLAETSRGAREAPQHDRLPLAVDDRQGRLRAATVGMAPRRDSPLSGTRQGTYSMVSTCPGESFT